MRREFADYLLEKGHIDEPALQRLADDGWNIRDPIGLLAYAHGLLPVESIDEVLTTQRDLDLRFGETAIRMGLLTNHQVEVLLFIQQYRSAMELGEALALSGGVEFDEVMKAFHEFWASKFQPAKSG
ncbi:MAG: hypothetical protein JXQ73_24430 [Phycisphaerae bacterium]|nr:hypothetical protein [Phycisphaerae bacterium]